MTDVPRPATFSPPSSLEKLPWPVLELISACLSSINIAAFSLTSTRCAAAARRYRLQHVHLRLRSRSALAKDLGSLQSALGPAVDGKLRYLRRLTLSGEMLGMEDGKARVEEPHDRSARQSPCRRHDMADELSIFQVGDPFCGLPTQPPTSTPYDYPSLPLSPEAKEALEDAWLPVANFIRTLSMLTDIVYACYNQVPRCLLTALHLHCPSARLHVRTFALRSLYYPSDEPRHIDPDEYLLATSPCLSSIVVESYPIDGRGRVGYTQEAIERMAAGLAPNLKAIHLRSRPPRDSPAFRLAFHLPFPEWIGFHGEGPNATVPISKGSIHTLVIHTGGLGEWMRYINIEALCSLKIAMPCPPSRVHSLKIIAQDNGFPSLQCLDMSLDTPLSGTEQHADQVFGSFIRALNPLQMLVLEGYFEEATFHAVLDRHGSTLRGLKLTPLLSYASDVSPLVMTDERCREVRARCPLLKHRGRLSWSS